MTVYRFEDLRVWQAAKQQSDRVGELLKRPEFLRQRAISEQMDRASVSVMNNISEGFLRHHDPEFLHFLRIAAASNAEVRSCFYGAHGRRCLPDSEAADLIAASESIGKMITRLKQTLNRKPNNRRPKGPTARDHGRTPEDQA